MIQVLRFSRETEKILKFETHYINIRSSLY